MSSSNLVIHMFFVLLGAAGGWYVVRLTTSLRWLRDYAAERAVRRVACPHAVWAQVAASLGVPLRPPVGVRAAPVRVDLARFFRELKPLRLQAVIGQGGTPPGYTLVCCGVDPAARVRAETLSAALGGEIHIEIVDANEAKWVSGGHKVC